MMRPLAAVAAFFLTTAAATPAWLDAAAPATWNAFSAPVPRPSGAADPDLARGGRCAATVRPATHAEDRALARRGWSLVGPYRRMGTTAVIVAASDADGMCRPNGYNAFVFVNGAYAGTLSPHAMDSRTDGALADLDVARLGERAFPAGFTRYRESDPLCCPHATTTVRYRIQTAGGRFRVVAVSTSTRENTPP